MSKRHTHSLLLIFTLLVILAPFTQTTNGDSTFKGNRRPGILAAPTEEPTGENALLYRRMGKLRPNELLDLLSQ